MALDAMAMSRYTSPVDPRIYPHLAVTFTVIGALMTAWFLVYEASSAKKRHLLKELLLSFAAAVFCGFGIVFLLLSSGIYV